ncbi:S-adenosyl-L-methionine-dependent methyltransferase [Lepidopterella palustris CBS 459.81]|uniref:S-adenosyl-L-methionine-dependent methyltransferase n=1 Tax=Lepidopterella palustris CBS 459.81 TaxID=1314670 RepID=A0A8E2EDQ3_9PEZI|nr:S-adenosyl-L-methionine-dependent methyltransferase [Lepidopterella palustris CBS 459.81]
MAAPNTKPNNSSSIYSIGQDSALQLNDDTGWPPHGASSPTHIPTGPIDEGDHHDDIHDDIHDEEASDSGFDSGSLLGDDTDTLASSIKASRMENGRQYHAYRDGAYWGPNDEHAKEILDFAHHMYLLTLDNKLHLAPLENPQNILDVGTGTGIWAIDMADQYPSANVVGTDLSPIQPEWVPPNCSFEIDDVTLEWTFKPNFFDFIHIREMFGSIPDWDYFFEQAFRHTKPGGYVEIVEHSVQPISEDDTVGPDHFFTLWGQTVIEMGKRFGKGFEIWSESKERMEKAGFVDVVEVRYQWPMNGWSQDKKLKNIGRWNQLRLHEGVEGFMLRLLTQAGGWSIARAQVFLAEMRKALKDYNTHAFLEGTVVYGRKPMSTSHT